MPKKQKTTKILNLPDNHALATTHSVFNLPKAVEEKSKIQAKDVFEGYSAPKKTKSKLKKKKTTAKKRTY
tara:strand:+ start:1681 stop:1890 length:210 start_codon:yes stop_codon:yes gene_type:complete